MDLLNSKNGDKAKKILCRKAVVPGFQQPTYVITYDECIDLIDFLPKQRIKHVRDFINKQFKRVRAGDQTLHEEIDARAVDGGLEVLMAQQSLGLAPQAVVITEEERALKKRKLEVEIESMEMNNIETQGRLLAQFCGGKLEARDSLELADRVRNVNKKTKLITHKGEQYTITVSARCHERGFTKFKTKDWKAVGKIAGRKYRERAIARGETDPEKLKPPKHTQEATAGNVRSVNTYMAPDDLSLIDEAIDEYVASMLDADDE